MIWIAAGSLLLFVVTFLPSFLEGGAFLDATLAPSPRDESDPQQQRTERDNLAGIGSMVAIMVVLRAQLVTSLSIRIFELLHSSQEIPPVFESNWIAAGIVLGEVAGKLTALRFPERARRAARPIRKWAARVKLWKPFH